MPIDVHLMISPVDALAAAFAEAGADYISFHPDASGHVHRSIQAIRSRASSRGWCSTRPSRWTCWTG